MEDLTKLGELMLQWIDNHDGWEIGGTTQTCYEDETDFNVFHIRLNYDRIDAGQLKKIRRHLDKYVINENDLDITKVILRSKSGTDQVRIKDSFIAWFIMQRLEMPLCSTSYDMQWDDDNKVLRIKLEAN